MTGGRPETSLFVGHQAERDDARAVLERGLRGEIGVVIVEGEPGIGKTRLVTEAIVGLGEVRICRAAARELEHRAPYSLLARALGGDAAARSLQHIDTDPVGALVELLEDETTRGPVVVVLDDLHWSDPGSLHGFWVLSRHVEHLPVALAATCRTVPRPPVLAATLDRLEDAGALRVRLGPLSDREARLFASQGGVASESIDEAVSLAGGNPLLLELAVRGLGSRSDGAEHAIPGDARELLLAPLADLEAETVDIVRTAAALGTVVRPTDVATVRGMRALDLADAIGDAIAAGVLDDQGDRLVFRSPVVRDAIYSSTDETVRAETHRRAAAALADAGAPPAIVAAQLAASGDVSPETVTSLRHAADEVRSTAPEVAIELLEVALGLLPDASRALPLVLAALVGPLVRAGRIADAVELGGRALGFELEDADRLNVHAGLALAYERLGSRVEASEHWLSASALGHIDPARRPSLVALAAHATLLADDPVSARALASRAAVESTALGSVEGESIALTTLALCDAAEGHIDAAIEQATRAVAVQGNAPLPWLGASAARHYLGLLLLDADRLDDALDVLGEGQRIATAAGSRTYLPFYHWELSSRAALSGRLDDAVAEAEAGLALAEETGTRLGVARAHALLAHAARHLGDDASARSHLEQAEAQQTELGRQLGSELVGLTRALLLDDAGDVAGALGALVPAWESTGPLRWFRSYRLLGPVLARVAVAAGDDLLAADVAAVVAEGADRSGLPAARGAALRALGHARRDPQLLVDAVAMYEQGPRPIERAEARWEAGVALVEAGARREGGTMLREALAELEALGASGDVGRVRAAMRRLGLRAARRQQRPETGWEALTATERRVVGLVVQGLSNRLVADELFLSRYTVETHLKHAYVKLGVRSRVELTRVAPPPSPA